MPYIKSFDKTRIYYVHKKGNKETIIFIHAWPNNYTEWKHQINFFSKQGHEIYAIDQRGFGKSDKPNNPQNYSLNFFTKDLHKLIQKNQIKNPILIGHSLGGMVILRFAKLYPNIAKKYILVDTTFKNPLKSLPLIKDLELTKYGLMFLNQILKNKGLQKKYFGQIDFSKLKNIDDFFCFFIGGGNSGFFSVLSALKGMLFLDEAKILPKIKQPCLIIVGEKDFVTPTGVSKEMHKRIKGSKLVIIKNTTHNAPFKNPIAVTEEINKFIK